MKKIFIIGGTTFDHIVYLPQLPQPVPQTIHVAPFNEATGSTGAGKALNLTKLAVPNTLHSVLGNDEYGKKIIAFLNEQAVDFIYDVDPKGTERHINIMDADGGRISMFITQSSNEVALDLKKIEQQIADCDIVVLNIIPYTLPLIPLIKKYKKEVWTDLHDYNDGNPYHEPFIDAADHIFLSSDNLSDHKTTMLQLLNKNKELIICTHGKNGATALTKSGEWIEQPALKNLKLVDANGAGDSFFAGYLFGYLKNYDVIKCMQLGTICAAYCISSAQLCYEKLNADFLITEWEKELNI
ncbi:MAG: carbohydrate kinase family protein [Bacteroidota bacterium]|nr:carbohydrate kinase family protein [Bacteroidota bacterium]